jgi:hypothetical protein
MSREISKRNTEYLAMIAIADDILAVLHKVGILCNRRVYFRSHVNNEEIEKGEILHNGNSGVEKVSGYVIYEHIERVLLNYNSEIELYHRANKSAMFKIITMDKSIIFIHELYDHKNKSLYKTVTNDAEKVVEILYSKLTLLYNDRRLFYRDTRGRIDEIVHQDGKFVEFRAGIGPFVEVMSSAERFAPQYEAAGRT